MQQLEWCGLDFGTSNSTLGVMRDGEAVLLPLEGEKLTIPSAIFFPTERSVSPSFGRAAIGHYTDGDSGRLLRAIKTVLGSSLMQSQTSVQGRLVPFGEIVTTFIRHLKTQAEQRLGGPLTQVVLGRPVHFVDDDPVADALAEAQLAAAAKAAGFAEVAFQFEPIAAALAYEQQVRQEQTVLIVDIGGGTADFCIVRVGPERAKARDRTPDILANTGVHVGGTDFDRLFSLHRVLPHLGYGSPHVNGKQTVPSGVYFDLASWHRIHNLYGKQMPQMLQTMEDEAAQPHLVARLRQVVAQRQGHALAGLVEDAKIALTEQPQVTLDLARVGTTGLVPLDGAALEEALGAAVARIDGALQLALTQAGLTPAWIEAVFLTGGSTQVPLVQRVLLRPFPHAKVVAGDMFGSVGVGLTLAAKGRFGA
jgi:hypothetical chaperone protein